jgi:hypothetical protein
MYNCTCIVHYQDETRPSDDARPLAVSRSLLTVYTKEYCKEKHKGHLQGEYFPVHCDKYNVYTYFGLKFSKTVLLKVNHVKCKKICI